MARRQAVIAHLAPHIDGVLVTKQVNVRYLTGFSGSNGAVLLLRDGSTVLATDGRYVEQAGEEAGDVELLVTRAPAVDALGRAASSGVRALGLEWHHVTLVMYRRLLDSAGAIRLDDVGTPVEDCRRVKDSDEHVLLRQACAITDAVFAEVVETLRPGRTERALAGEMATMMRSLGADGPAFPSIVAFGPHSSVPHHQPTDRPLQRGDLVKLDFGAIFGGYAADMTRTLVVGPPAGWQAELHAEVLQTQRESRDAAVVGAAPADLDAAVRARIEASGHPMVHGLGHGVGLEVHEAPFLTPESADGPLAAGEAVTIEPGIYLPGRGGVRIEDVVLVGADGNDALTSSTRELLVVG